MLKSLEYILILKNKNKNKITYEDYQKVYMELVDLMFNKDGLISYSEMANYLDQIHILEEEFPEFSKKDIEEFKENEKTLKDELKKKEV